MICIQYTNTEFFTILSVSVKGGVILRNVLGLRQGLRFDLGFSLGPNTNPLPQS